jgi:hypothetical protein
LPYGEVILGDNAEGIGYPVVTASVFLVFIIGVLALVAIRAPVSAALGTGIV